MNINANIFILLFLLLCKLSLQLILVNPLVSSLYSRDVIQQFGILNLPHKIFEFPSQALANVTIDFRQMYAYNTSYLNFSYSLDWDIAFILLETISSDLFTSDNLTDTKGIDLPSTFIEEVHNLVEVHSFNIYSSQDQQIAIMIRIFNTSFLNQRLNFINSVSLEILRPKRASLGTDLAFAFYISSQSINIPVNAVNMSNSFKFPSELVSYKQKYYNSSDDLNLFDFSDTPANSLPSNYFGNLNGVFIPHLPYFSNCRQFGSQGIFYAISEDPNNCSLIPHNEVKPIDPFTFGDIPYSDTCNNVSFDCVMDEYLQLSYTQPTWFQQSSQTVLFQVTPLPIDLDESDTTNSDHPTGNLINIRQKGSIPSGSLPKKVLFNLNYYQISKKEKQIISGSLSFSSIVDVTADELDGSTPFKYQLIISFHSMSQPELTKQFALSIKVYLLVYFIIGSISFITICIFAFYHALLRKKKSKIPLRIKECLVLIYPSALYGTYLAVAPLGIILFLKLFIMGGEMWGTPLNFFGCNPSTSSNCYLSIFDVVRNGIDLSDSEMQNKRNGRCGVATIVIGLYIMNLCADLLISESKTNIGKLLGKVSFDGNIWFVRYWEKTHFLLFYVAMIIVMEYIIYWSMSNNFGSNVWYYLVTLKCIGMVSESLGERFFEREHLLAPISTGLDCVLDIATLGANDFFDFMLSFYWEQGIQMIERAYVGVTMGYFIDFIQNKFAQLKGILIAAWEKNQTEETEDTAPELMSRRNEISLSNSNIVLSDYFQESFDSRSGDDWLKSDESQDEKRFSEQAKKIQNKIKSKFNFTGKQNIQSITKLMQQQQRLQKIASFDEDIDEDPYEVGFKNKLDQQFVKKELMRQQNQAAEQKKFNEKLQKEALMKLKIYQEPKDEIDTSSNECISRYAEFVNGMIGFLLLPVVVLQCWVFYDQNSLANDYGINRESYIFYFLFAVLIIPFRIGIDIVYYHLWIVYHDIDISVYAAKVKMRFQNRRKIWKADQTTSESSSEEEHQKNGDSESDKQEKEEKAVLKDIDKWCFSSQYYFVQALMLLGMMQVVIGIYGIASSTHNLFSDFMLLPIVLTWYGICILVHKFCIFAGSHIGIWKIKNQNLQNQKTQENEEKNMDSHNSKGEDIETGANSNLWGKNNAQHEEEKEKKILFQAVAENLEKTQFENISFRKNFILSNKQWLKNNISKILNKQVKEQYRDLILEQMENIDSKLKMKRNVKKYQLMKRMRTMQGGFLMDEKEGGLKNMKRMIHKKDKEGKTNYYESHEEDEFLEFEEHDALINPEPRENFGQIEQIKPNRPTEITIQTKLILKYWLARSRNYKKACCLIGGIVDRNIQNQCTFCEQSWGLICLPERNIEDLLLAFLKRICQKNIFNDKQKDGWQDYFQQNCKFRTECLSCNQIIADNFAQRYEAAKRKGKAAYIKKQQTIEGEQRYQSSYFNFFSLEKDKNQDEDDFTKSRQTIKVDGTTIEEEKEDYDSLFQQKMKVNGGFESNFFRDKRKSIHRLTNSRFKSITPKTTKRDSLLDINHSRNSLVCSTSKFKTPAVPTTNELHIPSLTMEEYKSENEGQLSTQHMNSKENLFKEKKASNLKLENSNFSLIPLRKYSDFEDDVGKSIPPSMRDELESRLEEEENNILNQDKQKQRLLAEEKIQDTLFTQSEANDHSQILEYKRDKIDMIKGSKSSSNSSESSSNNSSRNSSSSNNSQISQKLKKKIESTNNVLKPKIKIQISLIQKLTILCKEWKRQALIQGQQQKLID